MPQHSWLFKFFYPKMWPLLRTLRQPFMLVTAMQDNSAPWEMFRCLLREQGEQRRVRSRLELAPPHEARECHEDLHPPTHAGAEMRHFISHDLMRHWFTQNYDLLPAVGRRINYKSEDFYESRCTQELGTNSKRNSDVDLVRERAPVAILQATHVGLKTRRCASLGRCTRQRWWPRYLRSRLGSASPVPSCPSGETLWRTRRRDH